VHESGLLLLVGPRNCLNSPVPQHEPPYFPPKKIPATCTQSVPSTSCPRVPRLLSWVVNVAKNATRRLPRPLPPRAPSPSAGPFRYLLSINPALCPLCRRLPRPSRGGKLSSDLHESPVTSHKSRLFMRLPALQLSCLSFSHPRPLFSIVCGLFFKNTGGWGCLASNSVYRSASVSLCRRLPRPGRGDKSSSLTTFRINTCISVASKQLYPPLESTLALLTSCRARRCLKR